MQAFPVSTLNCDTEILSRLGLGLKPWKIHELALKTNMKQNLRVRHLIYRDANNIQD